jgi:hypothetical protein
MATKSQPEREPANCERFEGDDKTEEFDLSEQLDVLSNMSDDNDNEDED